MEELKDENWVSMGVIHLKDDKLATKIKRVLISKAGEIQLTADVIMFPYKSLPIRAGLIYTIPTRFDADGNIACRLNGRRFCCEYKDTEQVAQWTAESAAVRAGWEAQRAEKKVAEDDPLARALRPVTKAYHNAVGRNRHQILARAVEIIVSGKGI